MPRGRSERVYTQDAIELLESTTLTHSQIAGIINERYNVSIGGGTIGYVKRKHNIKRPAKNELNDSQVKELSQSEPSEPSKKSQISNEKFIPIESIRVMLRIAGLKVNEYKNKALKNSYLAHFRNVQEFIGYAEGAK